MKALVLKEKGNIEFVEEQLNKWRDELLKGNQ